MRIINFSHPLTSANLQELAKLVGIQVRDIEVSEVPNYIDFSKSLSLQVEEMVNSAGLTSKQWQTLPLVINLPALNYSAAALLAILHGRMGYFPPILRLRQETGSLPLRFGVVEILNLQALRAGARSKREGEGTTTHQA